MIVLDRNTHRTRQGHDPRPPHPPYRYRLGGERSPSHLRVSTHSSTTACGQRGTPPGKPDRCGREHPILQHLVHGRPRDAWLTGNLLDRQELSHHQYLLSSAALPGQALKRNGDRPRCRDPDAGCRRFVYVPKWWDYDHESSQAAFALRGGILPRVTTIDFAEAVRRRLAERGQSQYRAAINSGLPQDAIRSVLNGHVPRLSRVEQICRALGLELYVGPPRDVQVEADGAEPSRPLTRFGLERPTAGAGVVAAVAGGPPDGERRAGADKAGAGGSGRPAGVSTRATYGYSMVPTGIGSADFCLVSPCAKLEPGQRIWLRDRQGREGLRWLIRLTATTYEVAAWDTPKPSGHQDLVPERWERKDVDDRGVILAVYRGWLALSDPVHRLPDWRPGRLTGLWRALFDEQPELQAGGGGASGKRRPPPSTGGSRAGSSRVRSSAPTCRICCSKSRA